MNFALSGILFRKPLQKFLEKIFKKYWFWAKKWPIYPILGIIRTFHKSPDQPLYATIYYISSGTTPNEQVKRKVQKYWFWVQKRPRFSHFGLNKNLSLYRKCVKSVLIRSHFWSVFSCIRTEHRKIRTRNDSVFGDVWHSAQTIAFTYF